LDRPFTKKQNPFTKQSVTFAVKKFIHKKNGNAAPESAKIDPEISPVSGNRFFRRLAIVTTRATATTWSSSAAKYSPNGTKLQVG
jgi:hypothetical protein